MPNHDGTGPVTCGCGQHEQSSEQGRGQRCQHRRGAGSPMLEQGSDAGQKFRVRRRQCGAHPMHGQGQGSRQGCDGSRRRLRGQTATD